MNAGTFGIASGLKEARRGRILGLQPIWESPDSGTMASAYTGAFIQWSHGLGITPKFWQMVLKNLVTDGGWPVGYELDIASLWFVAGTATAQGTAMVQYANPALIGFQAYNVLDSLYPYIWNATANAGVALTPTSWRPLARIYG